MNRKQDASKRSTDGPLKFGLNIVAKKDKISKSKPGLFAVEAEEATGGGKSLKQRGNDIVNQDIKRIQEKTYAKAAKVQQEALEQDANVFDYDAAFDDLKKQELYQKRLRDGDDGSSKKKARYMADLIKSASERKLYMEKAAERKLQKEREEEGDEFGDKEEFVTEAYLERQREIKRLEEEQRKLDEKEADPHRERDMSGFYRDLLEKSERKTPILLGDKSMAAAILSGPDGAVGSAEDYLNQTSSAPLPAGVVLNDNLEVVDKRQLLTGGLNLTSKAKIKREEEERQREQERKKQEEKAKLDREKRLLDQRQREQQLHQQERNRSFVESQRLLVEKNQREKKEREEEEKRNLLTKSSVTTEAASDARARYLARKAQKELESKNKG